MTVSATDLAVVMDRAVQVRRVGEVRVDATEAVRRARRVRDRVPIGHAGSVGCRGDHVADRHCPVVRESFTDRASLGREAEAVGRLLRVLDRVAVLVEDHLGVLGVVHAALPEAHDVVLIP